MRKFLRIMGEITIRQPQDSVAQQGIAAAAQAQSSADQATVSATQADAEEHLTAAADRTEPERNAGQFLILGIFREPTSNYGSSRSRA